MPYILEAYYERDIIDWKIYQDYKILGEQREEIRAIR